MCVNNQGTLIEMKLGTVYLIGMKACFDKKVKKISFESSWSEIVSTKRLSVLILLFSKNSNSNHEGNVPPLASVTVIESVSHYDVYITLKEPYLEFWFYSPTTCYVASLIRSCFNTFKGAINAWSSSLFLFNLKHRIGYLCIFKGPEYKAEHLKPRMHSLVCIT